MCVASHIVICVAALLKIVCGCAGVRIMNGAWSGCCEMVGTNVCIGKCCSCVCNGV